MAVSISIQVIRDKVVLIPWWSRLNRNILFPIAGTISISPGSHGHIGDPRGRTHTHTQRRTHTHTQVIIFRIDKRDPRVMLLLLVNEPILITRRKGGEEGGRGGEEGRGVVARRGRSNLHDRINLLPNSFVYPAGWFFASWRLEIQAKEEGRRRRRGMFAAEKKVISFKSGGSYSPMRKFPHFTLRGTVCGERC